MAGGQLGENGGFEGVVKKIFDDHQLPAADKLLFSLLGFVFSLWDNYLRKAAANACYGIFLKQQDKGCTASISESA